MRIMSRQEEKSAFHKNEHIIKEVSLVSQPLFSIGGAEHDRTVDLMTARMANEYDDIHWLSCNQRSNQINHNKLYETVKAKCTPGAPKKRTFFILALRCVILS